MNSPEITLGCVANLYSRQMFFKKAGDIELGHTHQFDHLTLLASGSLKVTVDGFETIFIAPHMIYIHKDKVHQLEALKDNTVCYCIHALRDNNGDILSPDMVPEASSINEKVTDPSVQPLITNPYRYIYLHESVKE